MIIFELDRFLDTSSPALLSYQLTSKIGDFTRSDPKVVHFSRVLLGKSPKYPTLVYKLDA